MQINNVSQCVQIELQERDALKANLIALVRCACDYNINVIITIILYHHILQVPVASDSRLSSLKTVTVEVSVTWSTRNEVTWSLQLLKSPFPWEHTIKIECQ